MKTNVPIEAKFQSVNESILNSLKPLGFARKGTELRLVQNDCAAIVQVQRSVANTVDSIRFTVNVGIVCGAIPSMGIPRFKKAKLIDAHLTCRLGDFLPGSPDKWWLLDSQTDTEAVKREVLPLLIDYAIPFLVEHTRTDKLVELWRSGNSPGITDVQRKRYLDELTAVSARGGG